MERVLVNDDLLWHQNSQTLYLNIAISAIGIVIIIYSLKGKSIAGVLENSPFEKLITPKLIRILLWTSIIIIAITIFGKFLSGG